MGLRSTLFKGDPALEACRIRHSAHILPGAVGPHVGKIQNALWELDKLRIDPGELAARRYGPSTAAAVLAYKRKRHIINFSYERTEDNIVGMKTIDAMDTELARSGPGPAPSPAPPALPSCGVSRVVDSGTLFGLAVSKSILGGVEAVFEFNNRLPTEVTLDIALSVAGSPFAPKSVKVPGFGTHKESFVDIKDPAPLLWSFTLNATTTLPATFGPVPLPAPPLPLPIPGTFPLPAPFGPVTLPALVQFSFSTNWKPGDPPCAL